MRYYDIQIKGKRSKRWTSHPSGIQSPPDPGALKVEFDIFQSGQHGPIPGTHVRVWGIALEDIGRASDFNGAQVDIRGGMGKGLPLANPKLAGLLVGGTIQQAFANWVGTTMTLELIMVQGTPTAGTGAAQNIVVDWPKQQPMSTMLNNLLPRLFPGKKLDINISPKLVLPYHEHHFAGTVPQLAEYLIEQSRRILLTGPALTGQWNTPNNALSTYSGVQMVLEGERVRVFDGTKPSEPKQITIYDLVGQPTWIGPQTIQITLVMRGDLNVGDTITLPPTRAVVTAAAQSQAASQSRQDILFQGSFLINYIHHVGNYKDPGALSWVTVVDASVNTQKGADGKVKSNTGESTGTPNQLSPKGEFGDKSTAAEGFVLSDDPGESQPEEGAVGSKTATGDDVGLVGQSPSASGSVPNPKTPDATAESVGLKQSAPAPSLGESVTPDL